MGDDVFEWVELVEVCLWGMVGCDVFLCDCFVWMIEVWMLCFVCIVFVFDVLFEGLWCVFVECV